MECNKNDVEVDGKFKQAGCEFEKANFMTAVVLYSEILSKDSKNLSCLVKRSESFIKLKEFKLALKDILQSIEIDETQHKLLERLVEINLYLGKIEDAKYAIEKLQTNFASEKVEKNLLTKFTNLQTTLQKIDDSFENGNFEQCLRDVNKALSIAVACDDLKILKTELLVAMNRLKTARLFFRDNFVKNAQLTFSEALICFYQGDFEKCKELIKMIEDFDNNKTFERIKNYMESEGKDCNVHILKITTFNRGKFLMDNKKFHESAEAFSAVIKMDSESVESLKLRANCLFALNKFDESIEDCNKGLKITLNDNLKKVFVQLLEKNRGKNIKSLEGNVQKETSDITKIPEPSVTTELPETSGTTELPETSTKAEKMYSEGQQEFLTMNYVKSLEKFEAACKISPFELKYDLALAECYLVMENYHKALLTSLKIVERDKKNFQAYIIAAKCSLKLGKSECAENLLKTFDENVKDSLFRDNLNESELIKLKDCQSSIESTFKDGNYEDCLKVIEEAMKIATACSMYFSTKVECLLRTKRLEEADEMICEKLKKFPNHSEANFLKGLKFYLQFSVKKSVSYFEDALIIEPNFKKCQEFYGKAKKVVFLSEKGSKHFQTQKFDEAVKVYSELMTIDPNNQRLISSTFYHRGVSHFSLKNFKQAIDDFTEALKIDNDKWKALEMRAKTHLNAEEFADCVIDCEEYLKLQQSKEVEKILDSARTKLRSLKPVDHYKVLGVSRNASQDEIKQAYKKKTLELHTDKHPSATYIDKKKLERKFNEVQAAFKFLTEKKEEKEKPKAENFRSNQNKSESSNKQQNSSSSRRNGFNAGSSNSSYDQQQGSSTRDRFFTGESSNCPENDFFQRFSQSSASFRPFYVPDTQPPSQDFSTSFGGGCKGMVREGNGFRPCKKTINCPHHRAVNGRSEPNLDPISNLNSYIRSFHYNNYFGQGVPSAPSASPGFSFASSQTSNQCTGMVMDKISKTMRQCKNTRNCPHH